MLPQPMPRSEPSANEFSSFSEPDLVRLLEQHVQAGFPPDLALDLVLNELVVRAADATHASAAALALVRGDEMVCRAATGLHAPDLGVPLNTRDGLSGACVRTHSAQLCDDTEFDPRVDLVLSRRLGIRSILIVPLFDAEPHPLTRDASSEVPPPQLDGVLEIFSPLPNDFSLSDQLLLEDFARECGRVHLAAANITARPPAEIIPPDQEFVKADAEPVSPAVVSLTTDDELPSPTPELIMDSSADDSPTPLPRQAQPYESWTLILGGLGILAAAVVSFMIGSRIGWITASRTPSSNSPPVSSASSPPVASAKSSAIAHSSNSTPTKRAPKTSENSPNAAAAGFSDGLVVYEKGKVIFRVAPAPAANGARSPAQPSSADRAHDSATSQASSRVTAPVAPASSKGVTPHVIWLAPTQAEGRLLNRVEPEYPAEALAAHRAGEVTLEIQVAEDGSVSSVRSLTGDPLLAAAAAQAVLSWRYRPYLQNDHPAPFQTDVTLTFALPN